MGLIKPANGDVMNRSPNEFSTPDLYLAAFLMTAGVEMIRTDRTGSNKTFFVFDRSISGVDELRSQYTNNTAKIAAQPFSYNIKSLKALVHTGG